jgi:hypothetical protein
MPRGAVKAKFKSGAQIKPLLCELVAVLANSALSPAHSRNTHVQSMLFEFAVVVICLLLFQLWLLFAVVPQCD